MTGGTKKEKKKETEKKTSSFPSIPVSLRENIYQKSNLGPLLVRVASADEYYYTCTLPHCNYRLSRRR